MGADPQGVGTAYSLNKRFPGRPSAQVPSGGSMELCNGRSQSTHQPLFRINCCRPASGTPINSPNSLLSSSGLRSIIY